MKAYAPHLQTVIVGLPSIMSTWAESLCTIIQGTESQKPMLEGLLSFPVPLVMAYHVFLLDKDVKVAVDTVIVFFVVEIHAMFAATLVPIVIPKIDIVFFFSL